MLLALCAPGAGVAQRPQRGEGSTVVVPLPLKPGAANSDRPGSLRDLVAARPWMQPLASLVAPGSGQLLGGRDRGLVYLAAEVWIVARAAALTRQGRRDRRAFQDLAYQVARARFAAPRSDGSFEYYETMAHYVESGRFDTDPGTPFIPENDTLTFNGATWLLARRTYFANPDSLPAQNSAPYQAALRFYRSRAVTAPFQWSWRDARLEQDVFRAQIRASDDAFRSATNYLGALVLNHLGSAVDALITIRVQNATARRALPRVVPGSHPDEMRLVWGAQF